MANEIKADPQLTTLGLSSVDLEEVVPTNYGSFVVKVLYPYEKNYVVKLIADQTGNVSNLFQAEADYVRMICTLQMAVKTAPEWFKPHECLDTGLLEILYDKYEKLENRLQEKLKKNRIPK